MSRGVQKKTRSSGNVFLDLGFPQEEANVLAMRAELMAKLRLKIEEENWTQQKAAEVLGITQARVSDLVRGKWEKFSLDMLLTLAARGGLKARLEVLAA